jgi:hypothetical protein
MPDGDFYDITGDDSSRAGWKVLINGMLFADGPLGNWPKDSQKHFPKEMSFKEAVGLREGDRPSPACTVLRAARH